MPFITQMGCNFRLLLRGHFSYKRSVFRRNVLSGRAKYWTNEWRASYDRLSVMCLLLGTPGVGKTLLMKRLEAISSEPKLSNKIFQDKPATIPTAGTNLVTLSCGRRDVTVREIGGCMGPIWKDYFGECTALMFMIDVSSRLNIAASCIQLLSVISSTPLANIPVLLIFNKIDLPKIMTRSELESLLRLDDIISHTTQTISELLISANTGEGISDVVKWIEKNTKMKS